MASCPSCWLSYSLLCVEGSPQLFKELCLLLCGSCPALPSTPRCPSDPDSCYLSLLHRAWAQEKQALVSSEELAGDMAEAEWLLGQHEELEQEIKEHCLQAQNIKQEGQQLVDSGHFMSLEVSAQRWAWC